jgi:SulP family sulfate permease
VRADVVAGATTWIMLVPQAMGYALLAGLPPEIGLYASLVPLIAYAVLGTSRQLAIGPVALDSMMVAAAVAGLGIASGSEAIGVVIALTLLVGATQIAMGLLGLGFVSNFLSRPVLSGFMSAAALVIGSSQLSPLTGVSLPRGSVLGSLIALWKSYADIALLPLAFGLGSFGALIWLKRVKPAWPRGLLVVTVATGASFGLGLDERGLAVVGTVPSGLPAFGLPAQSWLETPALWTAALSIALVSFVESVSVGRHLARQGRYEINPSRELVAVGAANVSASLFGGYAVAGGFSRSAVNAQAGAKSQLAALTTASLIGLTLLLFTPLFHHLPKAVLAAIVLSAVLGLVDVPQAKRLWKIKRSDFWLLVLAFIATLVTGVQLGLLIGVGASIALFVVRATRPHTAVLGRLPGTSTYRNVLRFPDATECPKVLALRIDAQFYFGNVTFLKETIGRLRGERPDLSAIVLDASGMNQLDSSALDALLELERDLGEAGITLFMAHVKGPVRDVMERAGWLSRLRDEQRVHHRVHEAILEARARLAPQASSEARVASPSEPPFVAAPPCVGELA